MPRRSILLLALLLLARAASAAEHHVTPAGTPPADGSEARPWDLTTALAGARGAVKPGDIIWVAPGTYRGSFTSTLAGTAAAPITVRARPGGRVILDLRADPPAPQAMFTAAGAHTVFHGLEITCSDPKRITALKGSHPEDIRRGGISATGSHLAFVNCILRDTGHGLGFWSSGEAGEVSGCLIFNNGWIGPDRGHGHGIYAQNRTGTKRFIDNVIFHQFGYGIHIYGSSRASLEGFHLEGNVIFNNGSPVRPDHRAPAILIGGSAPAARITLLDNYTNGGAVQFGYDADVANGDLSARGNLFVGPVSFKNWSKVEFMNNTVIAPDPLVRWDIDHVNTVRRDTEWEDNSFVRTEPRSRPFVVAVAKRNTMEMSFGEWQTRFEHDSNGRFAGGRPRGTRLIVRPNRHEPGRAHVVVYNFDRRDAIEADFSAALKPGQKFEVRSAQAPFAPPILTATFDGRPVRLPMMNLPKPTPPEGLPDAPLPATDPEFAVFLIVPAR